MKRFTNRLKLDSIFSIFYDKNHRNNVCVMSRRAFKTAMLLHTKDASTTGGGGILQLEDLTKSDNIKPIIMTEAEKGSVLSKWLVETGSLVSIVRL